MKTWFWLKTYTRALTHTHSHTQRETHRKWFCVYLFFCNMQNMNVLSQYRKQKTKMNCILLTKIARLLSIKYYLSAKYAVILNTYIQKMRYNWIGNGKLKTVYVCFSFVKHWIYLRGGEGRGGWVFVWVLSLLLHDINVNHNHYIIIIKDYLHQANNLLFFYWNDIAKSSAF